MRIIGLFLVVSALIYSCSDLKKGDQLEKIDAMLKTVDSSEVVLIENQIDTLENLALTMRILGVDLAKLKAKDSIPLNIALKMDQYKWMGKSLPMIKKNQLDLKDAIRETRQSLALLKKDISNASGRKDKYDEYIDFEHRKVIEIRKSVTETGKLRDTLLTNFQSTHSEIVRFLKNR